MFKQADSTHIRSQRNRKQFCASRQQAVLNLFFFAPLRVGVFVPHMGAELPLSSAKSDMIRWSRVLLSHTLDAARSY